MGRRRAGAAATGGGSGGSGGVSFNAVAHAGGPEFSYFPVLFSQGGRLLEHLHSTV